MTTPRRLKLFYGSSYDRGLDILLYIWPEIREAHPQAEIHVCYGWDLFLTVSHNNPERMEWKKSVDYMLKQDGVVHHGRVGKKKLAEIRQACGIWAYPTYFTEINCITALDAQNDGLVPVVSDFTHELHGKILHTALHETVQAGVKIPGDVRESHVQKQFETEIIALMGDQARWELESEKAKKHAQTYTWKNVAKQWAKALKTPVTQPKLSIITITIRRGWWRVMAENLAAQSYKNFEWIIVDDYGIDRSDIAKKYAKQYGLDITYVRGDKAKGTYNRRYGLARANNIGWKHATGELLVYLQDFILLEKHSIEHIVDIHRHNPNALIAPTDVYFKAKNADLSNEEDWWNGQDPLIEQNWRNIRNSFDGMRSVDNPLDFEMNYAAIPKTIVSQLNGWWEFFDDGLGFDNAEIAFRSLEAGYSIIVDDSNVAKCIDIWPFIGGTDENIKERERHLGLPLWAYFETCMKNGSLPLVRDEVIEKDIVLDYSVPDDIKDKDCAAWIKKNALSIANTWL